MAKGRHTNFAWSKNSGCPYLLISFTLIDDILEIEEPCPVENNSSKAENKEEGQGSSPGVDGSKLKAEDRHKDTEASTYVKVPNINDMFNQKIWSRL